MFRILRGLIVVLLCLAVNGVAAAQEVQTPENAIPGQYIVVLDDQQGGHKSAWPHYVLRGHTGARLFYGLAHQRLNSNVLPRQTSAIE